MLCSMYRLVFLTGPRKGRRLAVQEGDLLLGRDPDCHVPLQDPSVSGRHAVLEDGAAGVVIRALPGAGSLVVNGEEVRERPLRHGDEIDIGRERLLFQLIQQDQRLKKRRFSKFHGLTFVAVSGILILQLLILAGLFIFWRMDPIHIPVAEEEELDDGDAADMERAILERRLGAWVEGPAHDEEGEEGLAVPRPFDLLPPWIVAPDVEQLLPSVRALDERGAADLFPAEEE